MRITRKKRESNKINAAFEKKAAFFEVCLST